MQNLFKLGLISLMTTLTMVACDQSQLEDYNVSLSASSKAPAVATNIIKSQKRIVVLNPGNNANDVANEVGKRFGAAKGHVYNHAVKGFAMSLPDQAVEALKKDSRIKYIAVDKPKSINSIPTGVRRIGAHKNATASINNDGGDVDVDVAVIDTGIDLTHPQLNVFASANFSKGKSANDGNGHGTHGAGTIAGKDNGTGLVGVAPGARLWAVRVLDNRGSGWTSDIVAGIDYVAANADQIDVANMSLGGSGTDDGNCGQTIGDPEHEAICNAVDLGVVFVVAAGNESDDAANHTPAAYDEVITVSAIGDTDGLPGGLGPNTSRNTADDALADFSNFGADVDIAAPGVDIFSTWKGGTTNTISGTSMASPHVAGAAALYIAKNRKPANKLEVLEVRDALVAMADTQIGTSGFTGDVDGIEEPMLNAERIDPMAAPGPAVMVAMSSDQVSYNTANGELNAIFTISVADELGNPISGLIDLDFSFSVPDLLVSEIGTGVYETSLDLSGYIDGVHVLSVDVTDPDSMLIGSFSRSFETTSQSQPVIFVSNIGYRTSGGKNADKNLLVDVSIGDTLGGNVDAASVSIDLYRDGTFVGSGTASTSSSGVVSFQLRNAGSGLYTTNVTNVAKTDNIYDSSKNSLDPGFTK